MCANIETSFLQRVTRVLQLRTWFCASELERLFDLGSATGPGFEITNSEDEANIKSFYSAKQKARQDVLALVWVKLRGP